MSRKRRSRIAAAAAGDIAEDRISELPEEIIHNILHRVKPSSEAAKTSLLSRRWLQLWRFYPVVEFRDRDFNWDFDEIRIRFESFAAAAYRRLLQPHNHGKTAAAPPPIALDAFRISLQCPRLNEELLDKLLAPASLLPAADDDGSRSPLEIVVHTIPTMYVIPFSSPYSFPDGTFLNCRRTRSLSLSGCDLRSQYRSNWSSNNICLEDLCLNSTRISEQMLQSFLGNAPNLEKLSLSWIQGVESLDLSHPNLKTIFIGGNFGSVLQIQLTSAPLLHTLRFESTLDCKLNVASKFSIPNLKFIHIRNDPWTGSKWLGDLEDLISKSPSLESLDFHNVRNTDERKPLPWLRIDSPSSASKLRTLRLSFSKTERPLEIDAPNLVSLCIATDSAINVEAVKVASDCKCVIDWHISRENKLTTGWFVELRRFLAALTRSFRHQPVLKLHFPSYCYNPEVSFSLSEVKSVSSPIPEVQNLQFGSSFSSPLSNMRHAKAIIFLEALLWTCHPNTISVAEQSDPRDSQRSLTKFQRIWKQVANKNLESSSCGGDVQHWQDGLKDVNIMSDTIDADSALTRNYICFTLT
ncbi:unnamed protein product [Linum trigynum]|uniref:F-box domain-containing protein n=1 Tax=Linum trigynum TaxID=586398 RepID=A0AAV2F3X8_9ROSI